MKEIKFLNEPLMSFCGIITKEITELERNIKTKIIMSKRYLPKVIPQAVNEQQKC